MKKEKSVISRIKERIKPENRIFVRKNLEISNQITFLLDQKGWNQKIFSQKLGKQESEISKLLSGLHNLTLQSIAKMEAVLESDIITTPLIACEKYKSVQYITFKVPAKINELPINLDNKGYSQMLTKSDTFMAPDTSKDFEKENFEIRKFESQPIKVRVA